MKVFIAGATGVIGRPLIAQLLAAKHEVVPMTRVKDYKFATVRRFGQGYVAYSVLADLIRVGWRHSAGPLAE